MFAKEIVEMTNEMEQRLNDSREQILAKLSGPHSKARIEKPSSYPERGAANNIYSFDDVFYEPVVHLDPKVYGTLDNPIKIQDRKPWAKELPDSKDEILAYLEKLPKNPGGPTGITGPGLLGKPENWAADPIVMSVDPKTGDFYQVQILRDIGQWAIPGGMVDDGETSISASVRELAEETGIDLKRVNPVKLYKGYCDDFRNTDTHYMMTNVYLYFVPWEEFTKLEFQCNDAAEQIKEIKAVKLETDNVNALFASHPDFVKLGIIEVAVNAEKYGVSKELQSGLLAKAAEILDA